MVCTSFCKMFAIADATMHRKHCTEGQGSSVSTLYSRHAGLSEAVLANEEVSLTPHLKQQFVLIRSSGLRLLTLVNDILDATALQHGRLRLKQEKVPLKPLLDDVIDLTRPLVSQCLVADTRGNA